MKRIALCLARVVLFCAPICAVAGGGPTLSFSQASDGTAGTFGDAAQTGQVNGTITAVLLAPPCSQFGTVPNQIKPSDVTPVVKINPTNSNEIDISSPASGGPGTQLPIDFNFNCNPHDSPGFTLAASLGKLTDGRYTVIWDAYPQEVRATFAVVSGLLGSMYPSTITGTWYDPALSGSGFTFQMSGYGLLVTYYGWDAAGNRLWLTSDIGPSSLIPGEPVTLNMSYTTGGTFSNPHNNVVPWGTLVLNFKSCRVATATLSGKDGTANLNLLSLAPTVGLPGC
jgi:hypothetical protein